MKTCMRFCARKGLVEESTSVAMATLGIPSQHRNHVKESKAIT
jgi:hypothetical protein